jgi:hypothetical protein
VSKATFIKQKLKEYFIHDFSSSFFSYHDFLLKLFVDVHLSGQLLLRVLSLGGLGLQQLDVVHRGLQDGALVLANVSDRVVMSEAVRKMSIF